MMKKVVWVILLLLVLVPVSAFSVDVVERSGNDVTLSFTGFNEIVRIEDVTATVETAGLSDTFVVDSVISVSNDQILLTVSLNPIFEDYSEAEIESITISGTIDGEPFAKRVALHGGQVIALAPGVDRQTATVYTVVIIALVAVLAVLIYLLVSPTEKIVPVMKKVRKRKAKNKTKRKAKKRK